MILRLTAPIVALSLLLLAVGAIAAWYLHRIQKDARPTWPRTSPAAGRPRNW